MGWFKIINFFSRVPQTQNLFLFKTVKKETRDRSRVDPLARCLFLFFILCCLSAIDFDNDACNVAQ